jgi:hypothetical protein
MSHDGNVWALLAGLPKEAIHIENPVQDVIFKVLHMELNNFKFVIYIQSSKMVKQRIRSSLHRPTLTSDRHEVEF